MAKAATAAGRSPTSESSAKQTNGPALPDQRINRRPRQTVTPAANRAEHCARCSRASRVCMAQCQAPALKGAVVAYTAPGQQSGKRRRVAGLALSPRHHSLGTHWADPNEPRTERLLA